MKKFFIFLFFSLMLMGSLQAQFAKPLKSTKFTYQNSGSFNLGITGSFAANDMLYSAVSKSKLKPCFTPTVGLAFEWNALSMLSVGLDASYAMRGGNEVFATEVLTSYTTSTFARINYTIRMNAVEIRVPITYYFGYNEHLRPYFYVAPRFDLWLNGNLRWERNYDDGSYDPLVYESELGTSNMAPYDISAVAGVGLCSRFTLGRMPFFVKFDLSYGISVLSNFSQYEVAASQHGVTGNNTFQGWGDIDHEELGKRYLQNVEARLTLLLPLRRPLKDACAFNQKMRKAKRL